MKLFWRADPNISFTETTEQGQSYNLLELYPYLEPEPGDKTEALELKNKALKENYKLGSQISHRGFIGIDARGIRHLVIYLYYGFRKTAIGSIEIGEDQSLRPRSVHILDFSGPAELDLATMFNTILPKITHFEDLPIFCPGPTPLQGPL